jgi:phage shock protein A
MRLFRRVGDIIAANLNDLVDHFEDPEVMLRHAIREMETMIEAATGAAASAIAGERLLSKDLADAEHKARNWMIAAEDAVAQEDDDRARRAIAHAHEHEALARILAEQRASAEQTAETLRGQVDAMRAKLVEARGKLAGLSARRRVVEAGNALRGATFESSNGTRGFARFERMRRRIDQAEAEAQALGELWAETGTLPDAQPATSDRTRRVEADLATIRQRLRKSQS